jgi:hypothetical protein
MIKKITRIKWKIFVPNTIYIRKGRFDGVKFFSHEPWVTHDDSHTYKPVSVLLTIFRIFR